MICDYCDQPAKWYSTYASDDGTEPLCKRCADDHYGPNWRDSVRPIPKRDIALAELAATTNNLIANTAFMIKSAIY